ncbi:hypothetical protein [Hymenobacter volaticus]|uniref:DUF3618 domain-containing protein n=1 Tax=Hymenobacter volaticus TaxID=2932254 RepID=A0ABY4G821_9BACT|nr:hypothetical protein [Hymenobacter volaticus]UOQ66941.1 hypothetical protein MUN86_03240 [Hymenobacter volaticus]
MEQLQKKIDPIAPEDISRTLESAYHVIFQGDHDKIDDLLRHGGTLIRKAAQRFTTTQLILGIAGVAAAAVVVIARIESQDNDTEGEGEAHDVSNTDTEDKSKAKATKAPNPTPAA